MGTLQAVEVLKELLGLGDSLDGTLLIYEALAARFHRIRIGKDRNARPAARERRRRAGSGHPAPFRPFRLATLTRTLTPGRLRLYRSRQRAGLKRGTWLSTRRTPERRSRHHALLSAGNALAAEDEAGGPKVPRFVSLDADKVNLRTGPGQRYPIDWVLTRRDMPVEVIAQFETGAGFANRTERPAGAENLLTGKRDVVVAKGDSRDPSPARPEFRAGPRAEPGVIARLTECREAWCRIDTASSRLDAPYRSLGRLSGREGAIAVTTGRILPE